MARQKVNPDGATVRLCVIVAAGDLERAKAAAKRHGVTVPVFARKALADAVGRATPSAPGVVTRWTSVAGEGGTSVGSDSAQVVPSPSHPEPALDEAVERAREKARKMTRAEIRAAAICVPVESRPLHEHKAGEMRSGGIRRCLTKGCTAVKVEGHWVEP